MADIFGTTGDDTLVGTALDDIITTFEGNDTVDAGGGADTIIISQDGSGTIDGGAGQDVVQIEASFLSNFALNREVTPEIVLFTNVGSYEISRVQRIEAIDSTTGDITSLILAGNNGVNTFDLTSETGNFSTTIYAGGGADTVTASDNGSFLEVFLGNGDDIFNGGTGFSTITTGLGADSVNGGTGFEIVNYFDSEVGVTINLDTGVSLGGTAEGDTLLNIESINGSSFDDSLTGTSGTDQFQGNSGNDNISGLAGQDFLNGGFGDDIIDGGAGDDFISGGAGMDTLTGGSGADLFDVFDYENNAFADTITDFGLNDTLRLFQGFFDGGFQTPIFIGTDAYSGIVGELRYENSNGQTLLQLDVDGDGVTDQTMTLEGEFDLMVVNDQGFNFDLVIATPPIDGTSGNDMLIGTAGNDIINGLGGNDTITTLAGNDTVDAGAGADTIIISQDGSGTIDGRGGLDVVQIEANFLSAFATNQDVTPEIVLFTNVGSYEISRVERIESIDSTTGDITSLILAGNNGVNTFDLTSETGNFSTVYAGGGADTVTASDNGSFLQVFLGNGDDIFNGGTGSSDITTGLGADTVNGGTGFETVNYFDSEVGVTINLDTGVSLGGTAEGDTLLNVESISGSNFDDSLTGTTGDDQFQGNSGNDIISGLAGQDFLNGGFGDDTIDGGAGDDVISGGAGMDTLTGGSGADFFEVFDYENNAFADTITDFGLNDTLRLFQGFFDGGFQTPIFIGTDAYSNIVGELRYENSNGQTLLQLDVDGDGVTDQTMTLEGEFDLMVGSDQGFLIDLVITPPPIDGTSGSDTLIGTASNDVINGLGGNDFITTLAGNDTVDAGGGADVIIISQDGSGTIDGGAGQDVVQIESGFLSHIATNQDVTPEIELFTNVGSYEISRVQRIESIDSTTGDITSLILAGNNGVNTFDLTTETGNFSATIYAGGSDDIVTANNNGSSLDVFLGNGNDTFNGGNGFSFIRTGLGADTINGGSGFEIVTYQDSQEGVTVNLETGVFTGGTAEGDTLQNIEWVYGTNFDDILTGSSLNDTFWGVVGDDIVSAGGGNDTLFASDGNMVFTGGEGADDFNIFNLFGNRFDGEITDLAVEDRITISDSVTFIGLSSFTGVVNEIRYEHVNGETILQLDDNGDGVADHFLTISNGEFDLENTSTNPSQVILSIAPPPTTIVTNTNAIGAGSFASAVEDANILMGADDITFEPGLSGLTIFVNDLVTISDDLTIIGDINDDGVSDITIDNTGSNSLLLLDQDGTNLNIGLTTLNHVATEAFVPAVSVTGDNITITNQGFINADGPDAPFGIASNDRTRAIDIEGDNATIINELGASIITAGRVAVEAIDFTDNLFATVTNDGLIEGGDDGVRLGLGVVTNSGTIRSTGTYQINEDLGPGFTADAVQFFGPNQDGFLLPAGGIGVVNNLASGVIEGVRSGIFFSGSGTLNNEGLITANVVGVINNPTGFGDEAPIIINNSGTITRGGENFGLVTPDDEIGTLILRGGGGVSAIEINNSGNITSPDLAISINFGGATVTNELSGQILSDIDETGEDGVAFRGALLDDFAITGENVSTAFPFPSAGQVYENTQGITIDANGDFVIPGVGTIPNPQTQIEVANVPGVDNSLLPLVDLTATQNSGVLTFQTDGNGVIYPATIDVTSTTAGVLTVTYVSGVGFTVTTIDGELAFGVPLDVDFTDTIINAGLIDGDIITGLDDDSVTNTGVIDGDISLGLGNDLFTSLGANGGFDLSVDGGTGNDVIQAGAGDDTLNGGADNDTIDGGNGEDIIDGGAGNDTLRGGGDNDTIDGGVGLDTLSGGVGNDTIHGGGNNDTILGQGGADTLFGDGGTDTLRGGSGNDTLHGGDARDLLFGQGNNDILYGEGGNDSLSGAAGSDQLFGGDGNDVLNGSIGADRLDGGTGNDILNGGGADGARDTFVFAEGYEQDRINAFDQAGTDRLELDDALWAAAGTLTAQEVVDMFGSLNGTGSILTLDFGNGDILEVQNGAGIDMDTFGADILVI